jgi:hypothetical protein
MKAQSMAHSEKSETPKMEATHHSSGFLSKALADKKSLSKGKGKSFKKG